MYIDNLIQSIEVAKDLLLERIKSRGPEFYLRTEASSLDGRVSLYSVGCYNEKLGGREVFVNVLQTSSEDQARIERIVSNITRLERLPGKREYKYGDNFGVRFCEDNSVTIRYSQKTEVTNEEYRGRVEIVVKWLTDALTPRDIRKTMVAGKARVTQEETEKLTHRAQEYHPIQDITPEQIYEKVEGMRVGSYSGTATISEIGGSKRVILRFDIGRESAKHIDGCVKKLQEAGYESSVDKGGLWVSMAFKSMPSQEKVVDLAEKVSMFLDIFVG